MKILLYGANGYTAKLIVEYASDYDIIPILAGRNRKKIEQLAQKTGYDYRVFDLKDTAQLDAALAEVKVVLHAAGPFIHTAQFMLEACLRTQTHYLDITGEIEVFEQAAQLSKQAEEKGILIMPGVGFDVVPTDCVARFLHQQMPDATHLKLAFASIGGSFSRGTAHTMVEGLGEGSFARKNGVITAVPLGHETMNIEFGEQEFFMISIPWGDVATAYHTTGIPNITTYTTINPTYYRILKMQRYFNWLLRTKLIRAYIKGKINRGPEGPSVNRRTRSKSIIWGEVKNAEGKVAKARLTTLEGYTLTAKMSLLICKKVLSMETVPLGFQTPAGAFGADLILELPETKRELL